MLHQVVKRKAQNTDKDPGTKRYGAVHLKHWALAVVLCVVALATGVQLAVAQQSATLSGTVNDNSGAGVAGAKVDLTNEDSGVVRDTVTNGSGFYTLPAIPPGSYKVTVTANGFKQYSQTGVIFTEGQ